MKKITSCGIDFSLHTSKQETVNEGPMGKGLRHKLTISVKTNHGKEDFEFYNSLAAYEEHREKQKTAYLVHDGVFGDKSDLEKAIRKAKKVDVDFGFALYCFVSDALAGEMSLDEFCSEFGYNGSEMKVSQIVATHEGCKTNANKVRALIGDADIYDLINDLSERFG